MNKNFIDPKFNHIIKNLSKTNRKDYENYVINAVWHKLSNPNIEIIAQQYVKNINKKINKSHFFIDLYLPALNIGIECDEPYHFAATQSNLDTQRSISLHDVLYAINSNEYKSIRIKISGSIEDINGQINIAVAQINERIGELNPPIWTIKSPSDFLRGKKFISISDRISFRSINQACNTLFNAGRKESSGGATRSYFTLPKFRRTELDNHKLWFPKLAVKINDEYGEGKLIAATRTGWNNQINEDGTIITEWNENNFSYQNDGKRRVVFIKYKDPLGSNEYKFVGIFEFLEKLNDKNIFIRKNDVCPIIF
jgi:hypothetical protein